MKSGQVDQATNDENDSKKLKHDCQTGGTNLKKPAQPSQPDILATFAGAIFN